MREEKYADALQIILHAGNAKSSALMAIDAAHDGDFEKASAHMEDARVEMHEAHEYQFNLIKEEAAGNSIELNIILVHAQDHLTMAILASELAERFVELYQSQAKR